MPRLPWINFITAKPDTVQNPKIKNANHQNSGQEIAEFYKTVVSQPSENKQKHKPASLRPTVKRPARSTRKIQPGDIFKFAEHGDVRGVEDCISNGANVNCHDVHGWTPLMCAACAGNTKTVQLLLNRGADTKIVDKAGNDARKLALKRKHLEVVRCIDAFENGCSVKSEPKEEKTDLTKTTEYFCELCKTVVRTAKSKHNSSILHILNSNGTISDRPIFQLPESNVGYQLMLRSGWNDHKGLGPLGTGNKYPVKTVLKQNRQGLGNGRTEKPRVTHFKPFDRAAVQRRASNPHRTIKPQTNQDRRKREKKSREFEINFRREFY